ncbi:MAG: hypothetical protein RLO52_34220 [Sandaracinaceae bacterium]
MNTSVPEAPERVLTRVAALRDEAARLGVEGDVEAATDRISEAFELVDAHPEVEAHVVFASLLCQAAEVPLALDDPESAAALFRRAQTVAATTGYDALEGKALWGLSRCDQLRGHQERAVERAEGALRLMAASTAPDADLARAELQAYLESLKPRPWWRFW